MKIAIRNAIDLACMASRTETDKLPAEMFVQCAMLHSSLSEVDKKALSIIYGEGDKSEYINELLKVVALAVRIIEQHVETLPKRYNEINKE
jgi:hypothetical protein